MKYKFDEIKNGNISDGALTIFIVDHIVELEDVTPEVEDAITANGGQIVLEPKKKRKAKPVKWQSKEGE